MDNFQTQLLRDLNNAIYACIALNPNADLASLLAALISITAATAHTQGVLEAANTAWGSTVSALLNGEIDVSDRLSSSN